MPTRRHIYPCSKQVRLVFLLMILSSGSVSAQIFSPGKLIESHADLDHLDTCTKCHTLGKRSVDPALCLDCHRPLKYRLEFGVGYHASLEDRTCATCHKDHFGREFDPVRFDTTAFDHEKVGYALNASHSSVQCSNCHTDEHVTAPDVRYFKGSKNRLDETYLGLDRECATCHESDSKHGDQFKDRTCQTCHDEGRWADAPGFKHVDTGYALTGLHVGVSCVQCHAPARSQASEIAVDYGTIESSRCNTCHEDIHNERMGGACAQCHTTTGWKNLKSKNFESDFDHTRTGFELKGAHKTTTCDSCHNPRRRIPDLTIRFAKNSAGRKYAKPVAGSCNACHRDFHDGEFVGSTDKKSCTSCHGSFEWTPSTFDVFRHAVETEFTLDGAHLGVLCSSCHENEPGTRSVRFSIENSSCSGCHAAVDPHKGELKELRYPPESCETCHTKSSWTSLDITFDHSRTRFELHGRHENLVCRSCHRDEKNDQIRLVNVDTSCQACHGNEDPHFGQFPEAACVDCHDSRSFKLESFDHSRSRFALDTVHQSLACSSCHISEARANGIFVVRFKPLGTSCNDCHGEKNE